MLDPRGEGIGRQMRVVDALLHSGNHAGQLELLSHPLLETFLRRQSKRLAPLYAYLLFAALVLVDIHWPGSIACSVLAVAVLCVAAAVFLELRGY